MTVPLEISYRDVEKTEAIDNLIREKASKLEKVCDHIVSCRVAVEKPHEFVRTGNKYRVRLDISVPPGHSVIVNKEPGRTKMHDPLPAVIREAFKAAERQLRELNKIQREEVKAHPQQETGAYIKQVFKDEGYGFILDLDGREIYFHKNSLVNEIFENLKEGTSVSYFEAQGEKGPQASSVRVIDKSGTQITIPEDYLKNNGSL